jgi:N-acetylmuramic acid 6-phosphate (MurNAc-6-P) etherase
MLPLEEVVKRLKDRNLRIVSDATGINHHTVCRIVRSPSEKVEYETVKKLSDYLEQNK